MKQIIVTSTAKQALVESIAKWEKVVAGNLISSASNCPLCLLYNTISNDETNSCIECPIYNDTGRKWCAGTPYAEYEIATGDEEKAAAKRELQYLIELNERCVVESPVDKLGNSGTMASSVNNKGGNNVATTLPERLQTFGGLSPIMQSLVKDSVDMACNFLMDMSIDMDEDDVMNSLSLKAVYDQAIVFYEQQINGYDTDESRASTPIKKAIREVIVAGVSFDLVEKDIEQALKR